MGKFKFITKEKISRLPKIPGVYCFKNEKEILYIGKATNIRERVKNHFPSRSEGERRTNVLRTQQSSYKDYLFLEKVKKIGCIKTKSEIEALILEANLIKKHQPKYNVIWKDDKNYFYVGITKEDYPRIFITHQLKTQSSKRKTQNYNSKLKTAFVGPFVDGGALKETLKILRKVFPFRTCKNLPKRPCLWYHLERCPSPCQIKVKNQKSKVKNKCQQNAKNLMKILQGKKIRVLKNLREEMKIASKIQDFERAAKIRDQIESLEKILAHAKILEPQPEIFQKWDEVEKELKRFLEVKKRISRIEAYDASNIQGQEATGSMVTFINGQPNKNQYRKFKITGKFTPYRPAGSGTGAGPNDVAMLKEVLNRRFKHPEWPFPDLILIDGGRAQLNAGLRCLTPGVKHLKIIALAKKKNELFIRGQEKPILLKSLPREIFNLILQLRDEAHRFAISYHKKLREKAMFELAD